MFEFDRFCPINQFPDMLLCLPCNEGSVCVYSDTNTKSCLITEIVCCAYVQVRGLHNYNLRSCYMLAVLQCMANLDLGIIRDRMHSAWCQDVGPSHTSCLGCATEATLLRMSSPSFESLSLDIQELAKMVSIAGSCKLSG